MALRDIPESALTHATDVVQYEVLLDYGAESPLISPGVYRAVFEHHETQKMFKGCKVYLWFRIVDPGPYFGKRIFRAYRAKEAIGKPGKGGRFRVGKRSELLHMFTRVKEITVRPDRLSLQTWRGHVFEITVRTVTTDYKQRLLVDWQKYSVVDDVVRQETGS